MDVFYYWKDFSADLKANRIGRFRSPKDKLALLKDGHPDFIWAFKTPKGRKGELQLIARLRWASKAPSGFKPVPGEGHMYYDANDGESVFFVGSDGDEPLEQISEWGRNNFGSALLANFVGPNAQHEMRGEPVAGLRKIARGMEDRPFRELLGRP